MIKNYVLQADIEKDFVGVLSTPDIMKAGVIKEIVIPPEAGDTLGSELKVGIARRKISDVSEFGECDDITYNLFHTEKVWFSHREIRLQCDYKVLGYPWWLVFWVKNGTEIAQLYTIQVLVEE